MNATTKASPGLIPQGLCQYKTKQFTIFRKKEGRQRNERVTPEFGGY
jgi:hypothetical protein